MAPVAESDRKSSPRLQVHFNIGTDAAHIHGGFLATLTARCEQSKIPYQGVPSVRSTVHLRLMRKLIRKYRMVPSKFVTDRPPSYAAARAELPVTIVHERGLRQNNRAESSHVPVRRRERKMQRFRSAGSAQRFLSAHASVYNTFNICRHLITSVTKRRFRIEAFDAWRAATGVAA